MKILNRVTDIAMCVLKPCGLFRMADEGDTGEITTRRFVFALGGIYKLNSTREKHVKNSTRTLEWAEYGTDWRI